ncbi:MAG TPA: hypothetical protein ACFYEH_00145 [Candidatus Brocadiaceae bacterium]|nr:hypothetical protein [Candidatus Woesearchaeota archaeon]
MISRVIFIISYPIRDQEYNFLGIDLLVRNKYDVEIWNLMPVINPEVFRHQGDVTDAGLVSDKYRLIHVKEDFKNRISNLGSNDFLFVHVGCTLKTYFIYRAITKKKLRYGNDLLLLEFYFKSQGGETADLINRIKRVTVKKILARLSVLQCQNAVFRFVRPYIVNPSRLIVRGGNKSLAFVKIYDLPVASNTKTLLAHNIDYDAYLLQKDKPKWGHNKNIAVFLDGCVCFHPNYIRSNCKSGATPDIYFSELSAFFRKIEARWDVEVIIAKHPRGGNEYERKDYFEGRRTMSYRTPELVANSQFVILHSSMAIGHAVLFKKPVIFIITEQLKKGQDAELINGQAAYFGKKPVNISNQKEVSKFLKEEQLGIDENIYDTYKDDVIKTPGTPEMQRWEIIIDYLKTL